MRKSATKPWAMSLAGAAIVGATALLTLLPGAACANGEKGARVEAAGWPAHHQSILRLSNRDLPTVRPIKLGRNKAMVVELPREIRDVTVSAPEIMDAVVQTSNKVHLIGKSVGQSNAFFYDANGEQILTLEVSIEHDTTVLDDLFRRLIPGSHIVSEILNETIILTGSVRNPVDSNRAADIASRFIETPEPAGDSRHYQKVINLLSVEGEEQVMLRVVVAEVQRSVLKQFGVNVGAVINSGNFTTAILTENALPLTAAAGLGGLPIPAIPTAGASAGSLLQYNGGPAGADSPFGNSGISSFYDVGGSRISKAVRALERNGLMRTLAEPNLTAISGESAKFLAGGEYPIPVVDSDGQVTITYKEFGVGVAFTPTVLSEGRISLKIETEVSELSNSGAVTISSISVPALKKRQAKSTVELPSGGSLAMAGLISDDVRQNIDGVPGLKDVPILGTLFRSRDYIKEETELVVIVTPILVKPTARKDLARPLDGLSEASDMKANFLGHLNRIYGSGSAAPVGDLKGDYGFIVE